MFAYNPTVDDRSGEILAAGQVGAAQANAQMLQGIGQNIGDAIKSFAGVYAEDKALNAKAKAYGDFLKTHGTQLGFDPNWIAAYDKAPRDEQLAAGEIMTGGLGNSLRSLNYLQAQKEMWAGRAKGGGKAAVGDGGAAGDYVPGQGWL